jgi:HPr kinase/phosphorylase
MAAQTPRVTVGVLLSSRAQAFGLSCELLAGGRGIDRVITNSSLQKTGLALAGYEDYLHAGRVLLLAESEIRYLEHLAPADRRAVFEKVLARDLPCVLVTDSLAIPGDVAPLADAAAVPLLRTALDTPSTIMAVTALLDEQLALRDIVHGVLVDVLGLGVLITGESGIGKSECALDLVVRGHRLVADDAVEVCRHADGTLAGASPELTRHHMEIRGIGLIHITKLFGVAATQSAMRIGLIVHLERWSPGQDYERLGLDDQFQEVLGVAVPLLRLPVAPGRNLAILVEVAARHQLLKSRGLHPARALAERLEAQLRGAGTGADEGDG